MGCRAVVLLVLLVLFLATSSCDDPVVAPPIDPPALTPPETGHEPRHVTGAVFREGGAHLTVEALAVFLGDNPWDIVWDPLDRSLIMTHADEQVVLVASVPVAVISGHVLPIGDTLELDGQGEPLVPASILADLFDLKIIIPGPGDLDGNPALNDSVIMMGSPELPRFEPFPDVPREPDEIVAWLGFLEKPIDGSGTDFPDSQVPGAPRDYRNGIHQGFDWYEWAMGVPINQDTPVRAMADGVVVRADHNWEPPSLLEMDGWTSLSAESGKTPAWIKDRFYGRQVWVQHPGGVLVKFAHLGTLSPGLKVGDRVSAGQVVGLVGNSGTRSEVLGTGGGMHLHADIVIGGQNIWLDFTPDEIRGMMARILGGGE